MSSSSGLVDMLDVPEWPCGSRRLSLSIVVNCQDNSWLGFAGWISEIALRMEFMVCSSDGCSTAVVGSAKYRRCMIETVFDDMKSWIAYALKQTETALSKDKSGYSKIPLALHNWSRITSLSSYKKCDGTSNDLAFGNRIVPLLWRLWNVDMPTHGSSPPPVWAEKDARKSESYPSQ